MVLSEFELLKDSEIRIKKKTEILDGRGVFTNPSRMEILMGWRLKQKTFPWRGEYGYFQKLHNLQSINQCKWICIV